MKEAKEMALELIHWKQTEPIKIEEVNTNKNSIVVFLSVDY